MSDRRSSRWVNPVPCRVPRLLSPEKRPRRFRFLPPRRRLRQPAQKPESDPTLKEISKLLSENPRLNLYVVGHTDNVGDYNYNMKLSQARADAVVKTLVSKYNVDKKRLTPAGVGPLSPVTTNDTEEGKAKNRRVELIKK